MPNTRAGANTKSPEGRLYSGLIRSKSNDVGRLAVSFLMAGIRVFTRTQLTEIKWLDLRFWTCNVISCEKALFAAYLWIISWNEQTNRYYSVKPIIKQRCHVDL